MPFQRIPEGSPNGTLGGPDTGTAFQTHILAAQTRAQPSRRKHNGPDGSARVIMRNTLIQVSDDAGAEAADSARVLSVAPAALAGDDATKGFLSDLSREQA